MILNVIKEGEYTSNNTDKSNKKVIDSNVDKIGRASCRERV